MKSTAPQGWPYVLATYEGESQARTRWSKTLLTRLLTGPKKITALQVGRLSTSILPRKSQTAGSGIPNSITDTESTSPLSDSRFSGLVRNFGPHRPHAGRQLRSDKDSAQLTSERWRAIRSLWQPCSGSVVPTVRRKLPHRNREQYCQWNLLKARLKDFKNGFICRFARLSTSLTPLTSRRQPEM